VRRVQHFVREEAAAMEGGGGGQVVEEAGGGRAGARLPSLATLLETHEGAPGGGSGGGAAGVGAGGAGGARRAGAGSKPAKTDVWRGRHAVLEAINELLEELEGIQHLICEQALEHVHSNETILTVGYSRTVHLFLREAAKKRRFQVVVAEGGPSYQGQRLAKDLASDGCVFALETVILGIFPSLTPIINPASTPPALQTAPSSP